MQQYAVICTWFENGKEEWDLVKQEIVSYDDAIKIKDEASKAWDGPNKQQSFQIIKQEDFWKKVYLEEHPEEKWVDSEKLVKMNTKIGIFENNKYIMKNLFDWQKFNENYPPGAEHDSRAPWNQKSPDYETEKFDDFIENEDGDKIPVTIEYTYFYQDADSLRKQITEYSHEFKADASSLNPDYIDEDIRACIENHIGDRYYDWEC